VSSILVLYHSQQYGNTKKMAEAVAEGVREAGGEVTLHNANEGRFDVNQYRSFDAAAFGTPDYYSYIAGTLKVFLDDWFLAKRENATGLTDKPIALFYSHGGGGAVGKPLERLFTKLGKPVKAPVESFGEPSAGVLTSCRELGRALADAVA
jgi:NAD(P)H dehydrogenase (quinone)